MEFLILPLVIGLIAFPTPQPSAERLADFSRLGGLEQEEVYVVDSSGKERRLTLVEAGDAAVKFMIGQQQVELDRDAIMRVERVRDSSLDGAIKGLLFGLLVGAVVETNVSNSNGRYLLQGALTYGGIGYLFDRGHTARQLVYRVPSSKIHP